MSNEANFDGSVALSSSVFVSPVPFSDMEQVSSCTMVRIEHCSTRSLSGLPQLYFLLILEFCPGVISDSTIVY